jgi:hypothetical protein
MCQFENLKIKLYELSPLQTKCMNMFKKIWIIASILLMISSCNQKNGEDTQSEPSPVVSVKMVPVIRGDIEKNIVFNGKTIYLKKNSVLSPISGYITKINISYGSRVKKNDVLFEIQTKENKALRTIDTLLAKNAVIKVLAPSDGFAGELLINQSGAYVLEGNTLCTIAENQNPLIQLNAPYEFNQLIKVGKNCRLVLPDNTVITGIITDIVPIMNESSQTQNVLVKPQTDRQLPENLNVNVLLSAEKHLNVLLLPKKAVMTNEVLKDFWVMKIMNDSMAVKISIQKGIENDSLMEVISSNLSVGDRIITEGAYGLPDSSKVKIEK